MTTRQQLDRMADRIMAQARADVLREAEIRDAGARSIRLCQDAVEAMRWAPLRVQAMRERE